MRPPLTLRELASRKNSLILGLTVAATALFAGWLWYAADYLVRVYKGPEPVTLTQLMAMGSDDAGRWFDVTAEVRPGHLLQTTRSGRRSGTTITNHFALVRNKALIVETTQTQLPPKFLAWTSEFSDGGTYYSRARTQLDTWTAGRGTIPLAPLLLTTSADVGTTHWLHGIGITAALLGLAFMLIRGLRHVLDYLRTPAIRKLRKSVRAAEGLPALAAEIDGQLASRDPNASRLGLIFTPSWLLNVSRGNFSVMSAQDVVWVAPYTITKKLYSVVPLSKRDVVHIVSRSGETIEVLTKAEGVRDLLISLYHWAPWAVVGTDEAMAARFGKSTGWLKKWRSKHPSRDELIAAADQRRRDILAHWAAQAAAPAAEAQPQATPAAGNSGTA